MPNSQDFDQSANSTLTKLLEVDAQLAVQEAELLSQLESVQEKRQSLKTVVSLFTHVASPATAPISLPAQTPPVKKGFINKTLSSLESSSTTIVPKATQH